MIRLGDAFVAYATRWKIIAFLSILILSSINWPIDTLMSLKITCFKYLDSRVVRFVPPWVAMKVAVQYACLFCTFDFLSQSGVQIYHCTPWNNYKKSIIFKNIIFIRLLRISIFKSAARLERQGILFESFWKREGFL